MDTTGTAGTVGGLEVGEVSPEVAGLWAVVRGVAGEELPVMGLGAGLRPAADVAVLASVVAVAECELARRMHAAGVAGCLPLVGDGAMLAARYWSGPAARRLARAGALAAEHPGLAAAWAEGLITAEHVDAVARHAGPLVLAELAALWGQLSPAAVARFVTAAARLLHPPAGDPEPGEVDAHAARGLSMSVLGDTVMLSATLPRLEGELVMAAIDALADRLRTQADHVPAAARRADALVELVNAAGAAGALPSRGGLPVALTVTMDTTTAGDTIWTTSRGHLLTRAEQRFTACHAQITPVQLTPTTCPHTPTDTTATGATTTGATATGATDTPGTPVGESGTAPVDPGRRIGALAAALLAQRQPLALGRSQRTATTAQRRALATRDRGCIIPGCPIPAEATQVHQTRESLVPGQARERVGRSPTRVEWLVQATGSSVTVCPNCSS
jgi:hypothetical protein